MMNSSFTIPRKPKFAAKIPQHPAAAAEVPKPTEGKVDDNQPIPTKKKRSVELIQHGRGDSTNNAAKRSKQSSSSDEGSAAAAPQLPPPPPPVYQKIKAGRTLGYPITVTQDGVNRNSQHDAILLNCNDENPEAYLAKFARNEKVKIKWVHAGYNDFVAVGTITLKKMHAAPPIRQAAANSGLLLQQSSDVGDTIARNDDIMHEDEDDDAPILKVRLNQMLEKGDEGENDKDENYNDQEDRDEPLVCYTKTSSVGFLNRKEGGGQSAVGLGAGGNLEGGANNDGKDVSNNNLGEGGTTEVNEGGTGWGGDGSNLVFTEEATPQPVTSNVAVKTDDIDTDDETTHQDKDGPLPQQVLSNMAIKTDDIDTDTEEPKPLAVTSSMKSIKTEEVDTDDEINTQKLKKTVNTDTDSLNLAFREALVLEFFEGLNAFIEDEGLSEPDGALPDEIKEMIKANQYLVNAKCPQYMDHIYVGHTPMEALCCLKQSGGTRDVLYDLVCLGGKATDKCYEYVMANAYEWKPIDYLTILLLSGYFPGLRYHFIHGKLKNCSFFLDDLAGCFDEDEEKGYSDIVRILHKDISLGDKLTINCWCGDIDSTIINNINRLHPLVIGDTHAEGGPLETLLARFPSTKIICPSCKASKLAWRFSEDHNCCQECVLKFNRFLPPVTSNVAIKTDDIDTDDDATHQDKDVPVPEPTTSNAVIKTDDIDTDTEETYQDKYEPIPESSCINTDTAKAQSMSYNTDTLRDRLQAIVEHIDLNGDVVYQYDVRKRLEKCFGCDLTKHQYDVYYGLNEQLEKRFGRIPSWLVKGNIVEVRKLRRKGSIKSVMENIVSVELDDMTTTSINYWHLLYVQPQVNDMVLSTAGKYLNAEGFLVAVTGENAVVNVSGNIITVESCSLAKICNFGVEKRRKRICSDCKELKNANQFPQDQRHNNEAVRCRWCKRREFLLCVTCKVSKRRLGNFTTEQSNKWWGGSCCIDVKLYLSVLRVKF